MKPVSSLHKLFLVQAVVALVVVAVMCPGAEAKSGAVRLSGSVLRWGQYQNLTGAIALNAPGITEAQDGERCLANRARHYPLAGASAALCFCQRPGQPFFSPDGKNMDAAGVARLREEIDAAYRLDMLPIVMLFDAEPTCRLSSALAYTEAAMAVMREFDKDYWFLLCVTGQCDDERWGVSDQPIDAARMAQGVAKAVHDGFAKQVVAAGGASAEVNAQLVADGSPIQAIVACVDRLGALESVEKKAVVEIVPPEAITAEGLKPVVSKVLGAPSYGFAVDFGPGASDEQMAARDGFLSALHEAADTYQKAKYPGSPVDVNDTTSLKPGEKEEGFVSLFNGKDLTGWLQLTPPGNFIVKDGAIRLEKKSGGWLRSWDVYGDFVFRAEYRIEDGGNSGFYIRTPLVGRNSRVGFECQVRGQKADEKLVKDGACSIYDVRPPDGNFMKPGEWNEVEIACQGTHVKIVWNGHVVHDIEYGDIDFLAHRATKGYIGLQDHHNLVDFRNLRIKRLD